ncbi:hypothetical protein PCC7418_2933 [Halothece sp. PCC 7418]|uniref:hypothetical protein n=1 Tax=Halothece sp. (strain PCC 7418) TaxID=65093 RepID=UPI0002A075A7|nr:hypothetical protein [Halothece sp. PCC 7418]AFZ45062.1 hypothetical protein PCC7418_2933 [Halothece sp. PCC 7418]
MNTQSENNPHHTDDFSSEKEGNQEQEEGFKLPDPDLDNVTVLTESLPNNPIIPWHHYDSPWESNEEEEEDQDSEKSEANENNTD